MKSHTQGVVWHELENPNRKLVLRASITQYLDDGRAFLSVMTVNRDSLEVFRTIRGAKNYFGRHFQVGGKWKIMNEPEDRIRQIGDTAYPVGPRGL